MANITLPGKLPLIEPYTQGENYFLHDASRSEEPVYYKKVIAGAKKSICILDPYALGNDATRVFECIQKDSITIDIITTGYEENDIKTFADNIVNIIKKNISSYRLNIISYKKRVEKKQRIHLWHDRYLIVDDTDCYLVGSSLDAQQTTDKHHGMLLLTEDKDKKIVTGLLEKYKKLYNSIRAYKTSRK